MTRSQTRGRRGFTLMEMLVVLGILAILLALAVPRILGTQKKANISAAASQIKILQEILAHYHMDMNEYPSTDQGLKALVKKPADLSEAKAKRWEGPYIESGELPKDPWGNDFSYEYPPKHSTTDRPDIWSMGPDGEDGTEDDIVSWSQEGSDEGPGAGGGKSAPAAKSAAPASRPRSK